MQQLEDDGLDLTGTFMACRAQLRQAAQKIVGTRDLAEDVVQEAYLKLMATVEDPPSVRQPAAYCMQVVRHLAIDRQRRLSFESQVFAAEEDGLDVQAPTGTPERIAISRQNLRLVERALAVLPLRTRQAFELYRVAGHTQKEIAELLGVSVTLVNFMIRDAVEVLAGCRHALQRE